MKLSLRDERIPLALSACLGGAIGLFRADWQWAVQIAQVQTGRVAYGPDSVPGLTQGALWSLTNQLAGLPLILGMSERAASALVGLVLGALWFEAVALFVFALSRSGWLGLWAAAICLISRATIGTGAPYPVITFMTPHTHGVVGLVIPLLAISLLAMERRSFGAVLLGLGPAFHATTGICAIAFVGAAILSNRRLLWSAYRPVVRYFIVGLGLTLLSLILHLIFSPALPAIDPQAARRFFLAFVSRWDSHRQPVDVGAPAALMAIGSFGAALASLLILHADGPRAERFLLAVVVACSAGGVFLAILTWVPIDLLPMAVVAAMPGRVINLATVMFVPLLFGLLGSANQRRWGLAMILILTASLLLTRSRPTLRLWILAGTGLGIILLRLATPSEARSGRSRFLNSPVTWIAAVLVSCLVLWKAVPYLSRAKSGPLWNRSDDAVVSAVSEGRGLLLTGGDLWLIQVQSRRSILLEGGTLDTLPYVIETSLLTDRVLRDVYGIDLLTPPPNAGGGRVPNDTNRGVWEKYPQSRWQKIRERYGVTQVLTKSSWVLELPLETSSSSLRLYSIPERAR